MATLDEGFKDRQRTELFLKGKLFCKALIL